MSLSLFSGVLKIIRKALTHPYTRILCLLAKFHDGFFNGLVHPFNLLQQLKIPRGIQLLDSWQKCLQTLGDICSVGIRVFG